MPRTCTLLFFFSGCEADAIRGFSYRQVSMETSRFLKDVPVIPISFMSESDERVHSVPTRSRSIQVELVTVLITCGAGFIGYHLARSLAADGISVDLVDDLSRGRMDPFVERDLRRPRERSSISGPSTRTSFTLLRLSGWRASSRDRRPSCTRTWRRCRPPWSWRRGSELSRASCLRLPARSTQTQSREARLQCLRQRTYRSQSLRSTSHAQATCSQRSTARPCALRQEYR